MLDGDATGRVTLLRARALAGLAALMLRQEDLAAGQARAEEALQAAEANDDRHVAALALFELGWIARVTGNTRLAQQLLDQSCAAAKAAGDQFWHATSVEHLGIIAATAANGRGFIAARSSVGLHPARVTRGIGWRPRAGRTQDRQASIQLSQRCRGGQRLPQRAHPGRRQLPGCAGNAVGSAIHLPRCRSWR